MSSKLSSLLVQRGLLSVSDLQDVFARQVIRGGGLSTILLERELVSEGSLARLLAEISGYEPLRPELLAMADPIVASAAPLAVAESQGLCPLFRQEGHLVVLTCETTDAKALGRIDAGGAEMKAWVGAELRVIQARALVYGAAVPPRYQKLVDRLGSPIERQTIERQPVARQTPEAPAEATPTAALPDSKLADSIGLPLPLDSALEAIHAAGERDAVLRALIQGAHGLMPKVQLYARQGPRFVGRWALIRNLFDDVAIRQHEIALDRPSVIARAIDTGTIFVGPVPSTDASIDILAALDMQAPHLAVVPLAISGKIVCVLVGHSFNTPLPLGVRVPLEQLAAAATASLTRLILTRRKPAP